MGFTRLLIDPRHGMASSFEPSAAAPHPPSEEDHRPFTKQKRRITVSRSLRRSLAPSALEPRAKPNGLVPRLAQEWSTLLKVLAAWPGRHVVDVRAGREVDPNCSVVEAAATGHWDPSHLFFSMCFRKG